MAQKAEKAEQKQEVKPEEKLEVKTEVNQDLELYGRLRNEIIAGRDNFTQQLKQIREAVASKTKEIENLRLAELKLLGAIEASEIYLKNVLPSNNPK